MFQFIITIIIPAFLVSITSCQKPITDPNSTKPLFDSIPSATLVTPIINEASGIADSKKNSGYLWVEEDSGNPPQLTLLKHNGMVQKTVYLKGASNRDWEDIILSGGNLYVGDIGDNNATYPDYTFYIFTEPDLSVDTITSFQKIQFRYPDGSHDAEAFLVEPSTGSIYIITKRDNPSRVYKLTAPFSTTGINTVTLAGSLNYNGVVSAALSPDAKELILKTYFSLNYYSLASGEKLEDALQKAFTTIPYKIEPQGEAVCFAVNNSGYFTLSERFMAPAVQLYFYKRN